MKIFGGKLWLVACGYPPHTDSGALHLPDFEFETGPRFLHPGDRDPILHACSLPSRGDLSQLLVETFLITEKYYV